MNSPEKVALFTGCFFNYYDPSVSQAAVEVLERSGLKVIVPDQVCCGLPMEAKGNYAGARRNIARNARSFRRVIDQGCPVVTLCPSCHLFLRRHSGLEGGEDGKALARSITLISSFLLQLNVSGRLNKEFKALPQTVFYQTPCHVTAAAIGQPSVELLKLIPGVEIRHVSTECCGLSGTWGYEKKNATLSLDIGRKLFEDIRQAKVDHIVTDCGSCRTQVETGTGFIAQHPVVMLKRAYTGQFSTD